MAKMINVTFRIEEEALRKVRQLALENGTSLNALFRIWVKDYVEGRQIIPARRP